MLYSFSSNSEVVLSGYNDGIYTLDIVFQYIPLRHWRMQWRE